MVRAGNLGTGKTRIKPTGCVVTIFCKISSVFTYICIEEGLEILFLRLPPSLSNRAMNWHRSILTPSHQKGMIEMPGLSILLIEPDALERDFLSRMLQQEGHNVAAIRSGFCALEKLRAERFDVIVTGMELSFMTGLDLLRKAREEGIESEFIIISVHNSAILKAEALALRAQVIERRTTNVGKLKAALHRVAGAMKRCEEEDYEVEYYLSCK